ncbi:hypothetical protein QET93_006635 [Akkermansia sp. N21116]|jgi:DNA repair exonuclease SbcCD ATPase subunit|uniref:hypothetical protein n=1 Tax=Akkermansia sp. N21116 TaxID=3040764 RepID=UPI00244EADB7|nr:hypothetical protein [Akkermansia sp. N21116]WPX41767.1 hypothetical protein QET93_006635 [Akkermansia sp. N21116]
MKEQEQQYRKMSLDGPPSPVAGGVPVPVVQDDMEEAQRKLEELRRKKAEIDDYKRRMEEIAQKKARFIADQNELGDRMFSAVERIEQELGSLANEIKELEQIRLCFTKDLKVLGAIRPDDWGQDNLEQQLTDAAEIMDHCEADYNDAVDHCSHMRHTKVLTRSRKSSRRLLISSREFVTQFIQGFSFHLPLFILLVILYAIVSCGHSNNF